MKDGIVETVEVKSFKTRGILVCDGMWMGELFVGDGIEEELKKEERKKSQRIDFNIDN